MPSTRKVPSNRNSQEGRVGEIYTSLIAPGGAKRSATDSGVETSSTIYSGRVPGFLTKAFEIFSNPNFNELCGWGRGGHTVVIHKIPDFATTVLPQYFKHSNYASFVRQLNMYDFHKTVANPQIAEFHHVNFRRGRPDLLHLIKRKTRTTEKEEKDGSQQEPYYPPSRGGANTRAKARRAKRDEQQLASETSGIFDEGSGDSTESEIKMEEEPAVQDEPVDLDPASLMDPLEELDSFDRPPTPTVPFSPSIDDMINGDILSDGLSPLLLRATSATPPPESAEPHAYPALPPPPLPTTTALTVTSMNPAPQHQPAMSLRPSFVDQMPPPFHSTAPAPEDSLATTGTTPTATTHSFHQDPTLGGPTLSAWEKAVEAHVTQLERVSHGLHAENQELRQEITELQDALKVQQKINEETTWKVERIFSFMKRVMSRCSEDSATAQIVAEAMNETMSAEETTSSSKTSSNHFPNEVFNAVSRSDRIAEQMKRVDPEPSIHDAPTENVKRQKVASDFDLHDRTEVPEGTFPRPARDDLGAGEAPSPWFAQEVSQDFSTASQYQGGAEQQFISDSNDHGGLASAFI